MSDKQDNKTPIEQSKPEDVTVEIGGKQIPFNKINKPHTVVLNPDRHKPKVDPSTFPDLEPSAKEREAKLEAERQKKDE